MISLQGRIFGRHYRLLAHRKECYSGVYNDLDRKSLFYSAPFETYLSDLYDFHVSFTLTELIHPFFQHIARVQGNNSKQF